MDAREGDAPLWSNALAQAQALMVGKTEADQLWTHQIQLTIADLVVEAHDTHHPLGGNFYYEDQKPEAKRRTADQRP